jgi:tetratricopeptide (TPR) repeat protein
VIRRVKRTVRGNGRWVAPARASLLVLVAVVVGCIAAEVVFYRWLTAAQDPAQTIVQAGSLLRSPTRLDAPLEVAWTRTLAAATTLENRWDRLLAPPLPPAICPNPDPQGSIGQAILSVDEAIARNVANDELRRRMEALRSVTDFRAGTEDEFLLRYNLARAYLAAGDPAAAAEMVEPVFDGFLNGDRLPTANYSAAERLIAGNDVSAGVAALGFHARFLAGATAYRRGEVNTAIKHFRLAINAVNYLLVARSPDGLSTAGHYQRLPVGLGTHACLTTRAAEITSLDAYSGLVAAYLAAPEFTDRGRLAPEVVRSRLQIDPDDPFRPVLSYAAETAARRADPAIPENVLWAASNLQRVYHYNRLEPDPRLEVTRAVLLLHLMSNDGWTAALAEEGDADVCAMLNRLSEQLYRQASVGAVRGGGAVVTDSARAAVAIHALARFGRRCEGWELPDVESNVRSAWIRTGGPLVGATLPALYEPWRAELERAVGRGAAGTTLGPILARIGGHRAAFRRGRVPADLPAFTDASEGERFVQEWWRALYADVARSLVALATTEDRAVSAGRAPQLLATLQSAERHAGLAPGALYAAADLAPLARSAGDGAYLRYRIRYAALGHPILLFVFLGLALTAVVAIAVGVHVNVWRYDLLTQRRLYHAESARRRRR